ncbi:hypothetical protein L226DRAFT_40200 [Lentinus tigrinus ALCF2SS1-7]|uniref:Uncharacterized protein n=1 Tax=Lentinus tigrinus ALCF2SS1-6 TaxID=1328759 RepID=A0A5C2SL74_9APHY|nr:hypothetical protein L227DRAFT_262382 [Lentinus tigrinus ALCF2SS1-6]RPD82896.1 hypothetical protein L226DRAFT_40200 [Lentinus tigrinus ALCF2SS1-7]
MTLPLPRRCAPLYGVVLLLTARGILGASNRTIDDDYADGTPTAPVNYSPPDQWSQGALCGSSCTTRVDAAQTYDHTYHLAEYSSLSKASSSMYIQIQFLGTAVYVYNILSNTTETILSFTLDGVDDGHSFLHTPTTGEDVQYNALVYSNTNLSNVAHTLTILPEPGSVVLFDYAVYTVPSDGDSGSTTSSAKSSETQKPAPTFGAEPSQVSHHNAKVPIIAGTVAGVVGISVLALALFLFCRRRRRTRRASRQQKSTAGTHGVAEEAPETPSRIGRANRSYRRTFMLDREGSGPVSSSPLREDRDVERPARTSATEATEAASSAADSSSDAPTVCPFPLEVQPSPTPSKPSFVPPTTVSSPGTQTLPDHGVSSTPEPEPDEPGPPGQPKAAPATAGPAHADAEDNASSEGFADIHVRYARLQQEVACLREQQEMQGLFFPEALPRYEDV